MISGRFKTYFSISKLIFHFVGKRNEESVFYNQIMKDGSTSTEVMKENIYKFNLLRTLLWSPSFNKHLSCNGVKVSKCMSKKKPS